MNISLSIWVHMHAWKIVYSQMRDISMHIHGVDAYARKTDVCARGDVGVHGRHAHGRWGIMHVHDRLVHVHGFRAGLSIPEALG